MKEEIPPDVFRNEDITKWGLIGMTHMEPRSGYAVNETTFCITYSLGILADDLGFAIEKINKWLGKPVVITCDEVTAVQLPQVLVWACHTTGVESVVFNIGLDELQTESIPSIHSGYQSYAGSPYVSRASGTTFPHKIPDIQQISGSEGEQDTARFEQWLYSISDARRNFSNHLVRAAINKSCMGDAADAICCLLPGATLDGIIEKFKWLYGSVESFNALKQVFYRIIQSKSERVENFVLYL